MRWAALLTTSPTLCVLLLSACVSGGLDSKRANEPTDSPARPDSEGDSQASQDSGGQDSNPSDSQDSGGRDSEQGDSGQGDSGSPADSDSQPPDRAEVCDGLDNDGDRRVDEDAEDALTWYRDSDGDGHGVPSPFVVACEAPAGYSANADDCEDGDKARHPGATEDCSTGQDLDCDGLQSCDDGDCMLDPVCIEDCSNGGDDNHDGYADCLDDECWAECDSTVRSRIRGGSMSFTYHFQSNSDASTAELAGTARSLSGSVQVSNSTGTFTCDWTVPEAEFWAYRHIESSMSGFSGSRSSGGHEAYSVQMSSGCPVGSVAVLAPLLTPYHTIRMDYVMTPWGIWYQGPVSADWLSDVSSYSFPRDTRRIAIDTLSSATLTWTR